VIVILFGAIIRLGIWGGLPAEEEIPAFLIGLGFFLASTLGFGVLAWHLLIRPLPAAHAIPQSITIPVHYRQLLASLIALASLNIVVGLLWDEIWHRSYGIPFGEDFFWRPHIMMYSGIFLSAGLAFASLYYIIRHGKGTLQQRFRANPIIGLLILNGGFMMYMLPLDPVWHNIYGEDISAWSVPHIYLLISFTFLFLLAVAVQLSTISLPSWRLPWELKGRDWLNNLAPLMALAFISLFGYQFLTLEWEGQSVSRLILNRPDWLLPAIFAAVVAFRGLIANHALRFAGAATMTGLISLILRFLIIRLFNFDLLTTNSWLVVLPALMALDLWWAWTIYRTKEAPAWWQSCAAIIFGMLPGLWIMDQLYIHPTVDGRTVLPMIIAVSLSAIMSGWVGYQLGNYLGESNKQVEETAVTNRFLQFVPPLALVSIVAFILFYIVTAEPPL
jgi:hypothetical protein